MQGSEKMEIRTTNALINEKSPYLLRRTFPATIKTTIQTKLLKAPLHSEVFLSPLSHPHENLALNPFSLINIIKE